MNKETEERIKADAGKYACLPSKHTDKIDRLEIGKYIGYIKGATVYNGRSNILLDALEAVYRLKDLWLCSGEVAPEHEGEAQALSELASQIETALEQWKGKEVELKEPDKNYSLSTEEKKKLLANKIEARMKEAGLQRQEFADLMGTQPSTITRWLSGEHNFQIDTLFEIEKQLNISLFNY